MHTLTVLEKKINLKLKDFAYFINEADMGDKIVVLLVGLERSVNLISRKLTHHFKWIGLEAAYFEVGSKLEILEINVINEELLDNLDIILFAFPMHTRDEINDILNKCDIKNIKVIVIEAVCAKEDIFRNNFEEQNCDLDQYIKEIILQYKGLQSYPLCEVNNINVSFIKIINDGEQYVTSGNGGTMQSNIINFVMNLNLKDRTIYFSRHGESEYNKTKQIGGNPHLTLKGREYAKGLAKYVNNLEIPDLKVWTSSLHRTKETAEHIENAIQEETCLLNEIYSGIFEESTYETVYRTFPNRETDKLYFRYPEGESYRDLIDRLEPIIMRLESADNVLVIAHQSVLRVLLGYFLNKSIEEIPHLPVPQHSLLKLKLPEDSELTEVYKL